MDFSKMVRDFQYRFVERPLTSWGKHEDAMVDLLNQVYKLGSIEGASKFHAATCTCDHKFEPHEQCKCEMCDPRGWKAAV